MNYHSILPLVLNLVLRYQGRNGDVQECDDIADDAIHDVVDDEQRQIIIFHVTKLMIFQWLHCKRKMLQGL